MNIPVISYLLRMYTLRNSYILRPCIAYMGRSIPSFRQLIEIEKTVWSEFKKGLKTKDDKKTFDSLFDSAKLYTTYLSSANRPIPIEPIMMGMMLHHYKTLVALSKSNVNRDCPVGKDIVSAEIYKPYSKELFDKTYENWQGLINSLRQGDREVLLSMLVNCCNGLSEEAAKTVIEKDSKNSLSFYLFFCLIIQNQKLIDRFKHSE